MNSVLVQRMTELGRAIGAMVPPRASPSELEAAIFTALPDAADDLAFVTLAALTAQVPAPDRVADFARSWRIEGIAAALEPILRVASRTVGRGPTLPIRIVSGIVIDLTDTSGSLFTTGIQRVARETVRRWTKETDDILLVRWNSPATRLEQLTGEALARTGTQNVAVPRERAIIIPFRATLILPEIAVDAPRGARLRSIAEYGGGTSVAIGFDCIPVSTAEASGPGMPGAFSKYLSTLARFDLVVPISEASAVEFRGWKMMLRSAGLLGPTIHPLELPSTGVPEASLDGEKTRSDLDLGSKPIVLAVGSHEPRKNHVNLLHAAELNWREGAEFTLVMVGGNSWETDLFDRSLSRLRRRGRRIVSISRAPDSVVWDLYRLADFSVFCSLNEGFGLPVVESLASGTPVITSNFGSTRALGEGHGALLVNPRDVAEIAEAMKRLLRDEKLLDSLRLLTKTLPDSNWDDYATDLLDLVHRAVGGDESRAMTAVT